MALSCLRNAVREIDLSRLSVRSFNRSKNCRAAREQANRAAHAGAVIRAVAVWVLTVREVLLVVVLGVVERRGIGARGGDGAVAGRRGLVLVGLLEGLGLLLLGLGEGVDDRAVLGAGIVALAHALGRVVVLPEDAQQLLVADLGRV